MNRSLTRMRAGALSVLERSAVAKRVTVRIAARVAGPPGSVIVAEANEGGDKRELKRSLEMIKWARAVDGVGDFPRWFPAARHITTSAGRASSARALRSFLEQHPHAGEFLWRQLFRFESNADLAELRGFVNNDLHRRLDEAAPSDAPGVERGDPPSVALLRDVVRLVGCVGARPFLVSGTLLGHVRDGAILEHDYDIDLGLLPADGDFAEIAGLLRRTGYDVTADSRKVVCRTPDGAAVDIFLHYERDGLLWHGTDIHEWWNTPFELDEVDFMGVKVWVPDDVDRYLTENYGDWSRPVAFYNFSFDTPNRVYRRTPEALLYLHKRFVRALQHGDRWSAESVARELRDVFDVDVTGTFNPTPLVTAKSTSIHPPNRGD